MSPQEGIRQCLYSIGDNNAFLAFSKEPVEKVIYYLKRYFDPQKYEDKLSLAISAGRGGARLSHDHHRQYKYVLHSLTLWKNILHDMFRLWYLAEEDLLSENNRYKYGLFFRKKKSGRKLSRLENRPLWFLGAGFAIQVKGLTESRLHRESAKRCTPSCTTHKWSWGRGSDRLQFISAIEQYQMP